MPRPNRQTPQRTGISQPEVLSDRGRNLRATGKEQDVAASHPAILALARLLGRSAAHAGAAEDLEHKEHDANAEEA